MLQLPPTGPSSQGLSEPKKRRPTLPAGKLIPAVRINGSHGTTIEKPRQYISEILKHTFDKIPRIPFKSNGIEFRALFDTGTSKSIMNIELFKKIDPKRTSLSPEVAVDLYDVNDRKLKTLGTARLEIIHGNDKLLQSFIIVTGTHEPCIVGLDGLQKHNFCFNCGENTIFRLRPTDTFGKNGSVLSLDKSVTLPPNSSSIFLLSTNEEESDEEIKLNSVAESRTENQKKENKRSETEVAPITANWRKNEEKSDLEVVPIVIKEIRKEVSDPNVELVTKKEIVPEKMINQSVESTYVKENVPVSTVSQGLMSDTTQIEKRSLNESFPSTCIQKECINKIEVKSSESEFRTVYKINHTKNLDAEVKMVPFKRIIDNQEKMFIQISNKLPVSINLKRKENIASINSFQIWDPGKKVVSSVEAYNKADLSKVIFRKKYNISTAKSFQIWDPGIEINRSTWTVE